MADSTVSHQTLLEQCAQAKPEALKKLYDHEAQYLLALGTSLLHRATDAEELVRESFVLIWHHAPAYDPALGSARAWIYSIFRFRALQRLKQSPTPNPFIKSKSHLIIPSTAPTELLVFQRLDEKARKMLGLAYLHGYSFAEIAKTCQNSIEQTQHHINQALLQLTQLFQGWEVQSKDDLTVLGMYCLGLLRDSHHVTVAQNLLSNNSHAAHDLLLWEGYLSALTYTLPKSTLPSQLIARIYDDLGLTLPTPKQEIKPEPEPKLSTPPPAAAKANVQPSIQPQTAATAAVKPNPSSDSEPELSPQKTSIKKKSWQWKKRYWLVLVLVLIIGSALVWAFMPKAPIIQRIEMSPRAGAILLAPGQSSTPGWIVTIDPKGHVLLTPQVHTELQADEVVQLWTQTPNSLEMRSLGLLNPNKPVTIPHELIGEVQIGQLFEMTLEPPKGSVEPSGAVLFIGRVVNFGEVKEESEKENLSDSSAV